ncbi:hypothetical protein ACX0G9_25390 [Flavitalea flava]
METPLTKESFQISAIGPASEISYKSAFKWSIATLVSFIALFLSFPLMHKFPNVLYLSTVIAVIFHFTLLPLIAAMPAPAWAKMGGFTWVFVDIILAVASVNGVSNEILEPMRGGVHVALIVWPFGIAIINKGFIRWVSIVFALSIGIVPLFGKLLPPTARFIAIPFILTWFIAIILEFRKLKRIYS